MDDLPIVVSIIDVDLRARLAAAFADKGWPVPFTSRATVIDQA